MGRKERPKYDPQRQYPAVSVTPHGCHVNKAVYAGIFACWALVGFLVFFILSVLCEGPWEDGCEELSSYFFFVAVAYAIACIVCLIAFVIYYKQDSQKGYDLDLKHMLSCK